MYLLRFSITSYLSVLTFHLLPLTSQQPLPFLKHLPSRGRNAYYNTNLPQPSISSPVELYNRAGFSFSSSSETCLPYLPRYLAGIVLVSRAAITEECLSFLLLLFFGVSVVVPCIHIFHFKMYSHWYPIYSLYYTTLHRTVYDKYLVGNHYS